MTTQTLQTDLLHEFHEDRKLLDQQIAAFDPLALQLRRPAAVRMASASGIILLEVLCYAGIIAAVLSVVFMNRLYPLYLVTHLRDSNAAASAISHPQAQHLAWFVAAMVLGLGFMCFLLARTLRRMRLKNAVFSLAGRDIKTLVGQQLQRKAALNALAQRHQLEVTPTPVSEAASGVNNVDNPGY